MLDSLSNIFKITELRNKILYTLMMFAVFRAGIHIPVPGVDASVIESLFTSGNLFGNHLAAKNLRNSIIVPGNP